MRVSCQGLVIVVSDCLKTSTIGIACDIEVNYIMLSVAWSSLLNVLVVYEVPWRCVVVCCLDGSAHWEEPDNAELLLFTTYSRWKISHNSK